MSSQIRYGSVVLAIALAGCASGGSSATATRPAAAPAQQSASARGTVPLQSLQWSGKFRPSQGISSTTAGRSDVNGSIRLYADGESLTHVSLSFTTGSGYDDSQLLSWGIASGDCGSNTLPLLPVSSFGQISISNNRGSLDGQIPMPLPTTGRYHANLYKSSGMDEGDVLSCASLQLGAKK